MIKIIWYYSGTHRNLSHYWRGVMDGNKRVAICGRKIPNSGDDTACPQNEKPECHDCNTIYQFNKDILEHRTFI